MSLDKINRSCKYIKLTVCEGIPVQIRKDWKNFLKMKLFQPIFILLISLAILSRAMPVPQQNDESSGGEQSVAGEDRQEQSNELDDHEDQEDQEDLEDQQDQEGPSAGDESEDSSEESSESDNEDSSEEDSDVDSDDDGDGDDTNQSNAAVNENQGGDQECKYFDQFLAAVYDVEIFFGVH